jgi:hypothetical protein
MIIFYWMDGIIMDGSVVLQPTGVLIMMIIIIIIRREYENSSPIFVPAPTDAL